MTGTPEYIYTGVRADINMLVVAHNRRLGSSTVHYLPEGGVVQLEDDVLLSRLGDAVIVQTPREKYTVEAPGSINMTEKVLHFVPFHALLEPGEGEDVVEQLKRIEELAWSDGIPKDVRRFLRLYGAIFGLRILDHVPATYKESVALTVSRLSGEPLGKLLAEREIVEKKLTDELQHALQSMDPKLLARAVNAVIAL